MLKVAYDNIRQVWASILGPKIWQGPKPLQGHLSKNLPVIQTVIQKSTDSDGDKNKSDEKANKEKCQRLIDYTFGDGPYPISDITGLPNVIKGEITHAVSQPVEEQTEKDEILKPVDIETHKRDEQDKATKDLIPKEHEVLVNEKKDKDNDTIDKQKDIKSSISKVNAVPNKKLGKISVNLRKGNIGKSLSDTHKLAAEIRSELKTAKSILSASRVDLKKAKLADNRKHKKVTSILSANRNEVKTHGKKAKLTFNKRAQNVTVHRDESKSTILQAKAVTTPKISLERKTSDVKAKAESTITQAKRKENVKPEIKKKTLDVLPSKLKSRPAIVLQPKAERPKSATEKKLTDELVSRAKTTSEVLLTKDKAPTVAEGADANILHAVAKPQTQKTTPKADRVKTVAQTKTESEAPVTKEAKSFIKDDDSKIRETKIEKNDENSFTRDIKPIVSASHEHTESSNLKARNLDLISKANNNDQKEKKVWRFWEESKNDQVLYDPEQAEVMAKESPLKPEPSDATEKHKSEHPHDYETSKEHQSKPTKKEVTAKETEIKHDLGSFDTNMKQVKENPFVQYTEKMKAIKPEHAHGYKTSEGHQLSAINTEVIAEEPETKHDLGTFDRNMRQLKENPIMQYAEKLKSMKTENLHAGHNFEYRLLSTYKQNTNLEPTTNYFNKSKTHEFEDRDTKYNFPKPNSSSHPDVELLEHIEKFRVHPQSVSNGPCLDPKIRKIESPSLQEIQIKFHLAHKALRQEISQRNSLKPHTKGPVRITKAQKMMLQAIAEFCEKLNHESSRNIQTAERPLEVDESRKQSDSKTKLNAATHSVQLDDTSYASPNLLPTPMDSVKSAPFETRKPFSGIREHAKHVTSSEIDDLSYYPHFNEQTEKVYSQREEEERMKKETKAIKEAVQRLLQATQTKATNRDEFDHMEALLLLEKVKNLEKELEESEASCVKGRPYETDIPKDDEIYSSKYRQAVDNVNLLSELGKRQAEKTKPSIRHEIELLNKLINSSKATKLNMNLKKPKRLSKASVLYALEKKTDDKNSSSQQPKMVKISDINQVIENEYKKEYSDNRQDEQRKTDAIKQDFSQNTIESTYNDNYEPNKATYDQNNVQEINYAQWYNAIHNQWMQQQQQQHMYPIHPHMTMNQNPQSMESPQSPQWVPNIPMSHPPWPQGMSPHEQWQQTSKDPKDDDKPDPPKPYPPNYIQTGIVPPIDTETNPKTQFTNRDVKSSTDAKNLGARISDETFAKIKAYQEKLMNKEGAKPRRINPVTYDAYIKRSLKRKAFKRFSKTVPHMTVVKHKVDPELPPIRADIPETREYILPEYFEENSESVTTEYKRGDSSSDTYQQTSKETPGYQAQTVDSEPPKISNLSPPVYYVDPQKLDSMPLSVLLKIVRTRNQAKRLNDAAIIIFGKKNPCSKPPKCPPPSDCKKGPKCPPPPSSGCDPPKEKPKPLPKPKCNFVAAPKMSNKSRNVLPKQLKPVSDGLVITVITDDASLNLNSKPENTEGMVLAREFQPWFPFPNVPVINLPHKNVEIYPKDGFLSRHPLKKEKDKNTEKPPFIGFLWRYFFLCDKRVSASNLSTDPQVEEAFAF